MSALHRPGSGSRGYALPLVLIFLAILAVSCVAALVALELAAQSTAAVIGRRQAFYECDNATRVASSVARAYLRSTAAPTDADLKLAVCGAAIGCPAAPSYVDGAFSVDLMTVALSAQQTIGAVPNGPFQGVLARQNDVALDVELTKTVSGDRCHVRQDSTVAEVKLSSFFVLVDGYADFHPEGALDIGGRVHANGDVCLRPAGAGALTIDRVTSAGRIKALTCPRGAPPAGAGTSAVDDVNATPTSIDGASDSGCVNCNASGLDWRTFALQRWSGNVQDIDHAVPVLRIPAAAGVSVAEGANASGASVSNAGSLRMLVEAARAGDGGDVKAARLAWLADVRILNGVWYKKDPGDPNAWPGIPIWSDHPVSFSTTNDESIEGAQPVGQANLFGGAKPRQYSFYVYDAALQTLAGVDWATANRRPVISYGTLINEGGRLAPGFHREMCAGVGVGPAQLGTECLDEAQRLVLGARSGFRDARVEPAAVSPNILPVNFDVGAFADALQNMGADELGTHFAGGFNGIVWIGVSWNNAHQRPNAALWPNPMGVNDADIHDASASGGRVAQALPQPLCATSPNNLTPSAKIPPCNETTRPNAVRVINAADLSAFAATGLTIATNGPLYLQGSFGAPGGGSANGTRAMLASDALTVLSPGFSDDAHDWGGAPPLVPATGSVAIAGAILTGNVEASAAAPGGGIENATRFLEDWTGQSFTLQGALAVGFRSVYQKQPPVPAAFVAPARTWRHDPLFSGAVSPLPASADLWAPPGMPSLFVQAIKNWQRD